MTGVCETSRDQLVRMVEAASLAPSAENTQPWRFAIDSDRLLVGIDRSRTLASDVDDMGRERLQLHSQRLPLEIVPPDDLQTRARDFARGHADPLPGRGH